MAYDVSQGRSFWFDRVISSDIQINTSILFNHIVCLLQPFCHFVFKQIKQLNSRIYAIYGNMIGWEKRQSLSWDIIHTCSLFTICRCSLQAAIYMTWFASNENRSTSGYRTYKFRYILHAEQHFRIRNLFKKVISRSSGRSLVPEP